MGNGYGVSDQELKDHSKVVEGIAWDVKNAREAAKEVGTGGIGAYGILGLIISPVLEGLYGDADELLNNATQLTENLSQAVEAAR